MHTGEEKRGRPKRSLDSESARLKSKKSMSHILGKIAKARKSAEVVKESIIKGSCWVVL